MTLASHAPNSFKGGDGSYLGKYKNQVIFKKSGNYIYV